MRTTLLGPQRFRTTVGAVVASVAPDGPVATVTAGWEDREGETAELDEQLGGRARHLGLYRRLGEVLEADEHFAAAALAHRDAMDEAAGLYSVRLQRALESVYAVQRRTVRPDLAASALTDGVRALQAIDAWYLHVVDQLYGELRATAHPEDSEPISRHRAEVSELLAGSAALTLAGGHVGILLRCLKLFDVSPAAGLPVVAWSAGAMALTDRVVLYHDRGPAGVVGAEVWDRGLGRAPRIVALPHARRRLRMDDPGMALVFARRFGGARCLLLDDGARVDLGPDGELPAGARVISEDGSVRTVGEAP